MKQRPSENIMGKGENPVNQHFLCIPQCLLPSLKQILFLQSCLRAYILAAIAFDLDQSKILMLGKLLTFYMTIPTFNDLEEEAL